MLTPSPEHCFALENVQVSPSHNTLICADQTIRLQPKVMAVLHYLALHHSRVISSEELMEQLWQGRIVTQGSVQKSINALRTALAELFGEREIITHYSKRGYQLTLTPVFLSDQNPVTESLAATLSTPAGSIITRLRQPSLIASVILVLGLILLLALLGRSEALIKDHKTHYQRSQGYTNETGYERSAEPHPDNTHVAYIREQQGTGAKTTSEILIRAAAGKDWLLAKSDGSWLMLAWSPSGSSLAAVELKPVKGRVRALDFYEKPNDLYVFHIFSLDLDNNQLLEKQLLSQWHGRIFSLSWWDETTLEIVAKQGPNSGNTRFRYSLLNQQLTLLDELEGATNIVASSILGQHTAIASLHKNHIQIDFLNKDQKSTGRWPLDLVSAEISWIPDGSGILVYAKDERKLFALYRDGEQLPIPLADTKDREFSQPRFRADGQAIFYTEERRSANILQRGLDSVVTPLTKNTSLNYAASFSPHGSQVVYASVRNNQTHLWLIEQQQERQLSSSPINKKVKAIIWAASGQLLVYSAGTSLYSYDFASAATSVLLEETDEVEPLAYDPETQRLLYLKRKGDANNLWRMDMSTQAQKQLTFGSLASALAYQGNIYFQYMGEEGLWVLDEQNDSLELLAPKLHKNMRLLSADATGIYAVNGGSCRESDIYHYTYANATKTLALKRNTKALSTSAFQPQFGALEIACYLPESNIMLLE